MFTKQHIVYHDVNKQPHTRQIVFEFESSAAFGDQGRLTITTNGSDHQNCGWGNNQKDFPSTSTALSSPEREIIINGAPDRFKGESESGIQTIWQGCDRATHH